LLISSYVNHTTHLIIAKSSELKVFSKSATWLPDHVVSSSFFAKHTTDLIIRMICWFHPLSIIRLISQSKWSQSIPEESDVTSRLYHPFPLPLSLSLSIIWVVSSLMLSDLRSKYFQRSSRLCRWISRRLIINDQSHDQRLIWASLD
jgi:hypothetical protein